MQALNAPTKVGGKMDFALNYELNLYRSGLPPREGMDFGRGDGNLAAFRRGAQRRHITYREIAPPGQGGGQCAAYLGRAQLQKAMQMRQPVLILDICR